MTTKPHPVHKDTQASPVRLQRYLASAGLGSRRHCEEYIRTGRVSIDGQEVDNPGVCVDPSRQKVRVDGELVKPEPKRYFLLNKPPGYLCTNHDPAGRPRAIDLVPDNGLRLYTVGRLDENSRGLLLVTNDGELANRLTHPRYGVPRTYRVQVAGNPTRETLDKLKRGLYFAGTKFRVRGIRRIRSQGKSTFLEITLTEGQNREIRRILARVGHKVMNLERISFGPLKLGRLASGRCRRLRATELKALQDILSPSASPRPRRRAKRAGKRT